MAFPGTIKGDGPIIETIKKIAVDDYFNAIEVSWIKDKSVRMEVKPFGNEDPDIVIANAKRVFNAAWAKV